MVAEDPLVGHLLQERVRELVSAGRAPHGSEHVLAGELRECGLELAVERLERAEERQVEVASEDRGRIDQVAELGEAVKAFCQKALQRRRYARRGGGRRDLGRPVAAVEHLQHLLYEQRDTVGRRTHPLQNRSVERCIGYRRRHGPDLLGRQRPEVHLEHGLPPRPGRFEVVPKREDAQHR